MIHGLQLTLKGEWKQTPMLVKEGIIVLTIRGGDTRETVVVNGPMIFGVILTNPIWQCLVQMQTGQIQIIIIQM
jgi:hypothetical protein